MAAPDQSAHGPETSETPSSDDGSHSHPHGHGLGGGDPRRLWFSLACSLSLMAVEVIVSFVSGSLTLFADAGHLLTDAGAIAGALWVMHLARKPASPIWSFGFRRAEILAAAVNGMTLLVVGVVVVVAGVRRLVHPGHVDGGLMVVVACVGVVMTLLSALALAGDGRRSLNVEGVFQHVLTDFYGFVGTAVAGIIIITTKWERADAVTSLLVACLVLRAAWGLLRASGRVLLEGTPESVDLEDVRRHLVELPEVLSVHDLHAWALTSDLPALSAHVVVEEACFHNGSAAVVLYHLQHCLANHFDVEHSTFQLEPASHPEHEVGTHD